MPTTFLVLVFLAAAASGNPFDDSPARIGEWGRRPFDGAISATDPPGFSWRPQSGAAGYIVQVSRDAGFASIVYEARVDRYNVHCPAKAFGTGTWHWRVSARLEGGESPSWSRIWTFRIDRTSAVFPMPEREDLLSRIPAGHPRLFLRPGDVAALRERAALDPQKPLEHLVARCERLVERPPSTSEPPKYPEGCEPRGEEWREIWWGNKVRVDEVVGGAADLGFAWLFTDRGDFGGLAKRILLDAAKWDCFGSTGFIYNDEAGMPFLYHFSRAYTFLNGLLSEPEKALCRAAMEKRGGEAFALLRDRHLWRPYSSHSNRAWHFLGEAGVAFLGEIPAAAEWAWFAANVFFCAYPVWCDDDGGWHEGTAYWRSYMGMFTWWADVMRAAFGINAYAKPYFSCAGYYPLYLQPPGTSGGGFGDLCAESASADNAGLMDVLARGSGNGTWRWYADAHGPSRPGGGFIGFLRMLAPGVRAVPPENLPSSRLFRGIGQAVLNCTILSAAENVEVIFKSSPFGSQSHGYDAQNSFILYAFGERLFVSSGRRDIYGSAHHAGWMWNTVSVNSITTDGRGQMSHSAGARGEINGFHASPAIDYVRGDAAEAYPGTLNRFTRHILFLKPSAIVIFDELESPAPCTFEWRLHSPAEPEIAGNALSFANGRAAASVRFFEPESLVIGKTCAFDPPPRPRIRCKEWHVTASMAGKTGSAAFVTLISPRPSSSPPPEEADFSRCKGGYSISGRIGNGSFLVLLRREGSRSVSDRGYSSASEVSAVLFDSAGKQSLTFASGEGKVESAN